MSKSSLFTLFITVIVVVIVAEVLANDYGQDSTLKNELVTNVLGGEEISAEEIFGQVVGDQEPEVLPISAEDGSTIENDINHGNVADTGSIQFDTSDFSGESTTEITKPISADSHKTPDDAMLEASDSTETVAQITFGLVNLTGFQNVTLQRVPFNGIMFERVDLRDFKSVNVIQQNLLHDNKAKVAEFYEFQGDSSLLANEVSLLIKDKALSSIEASINETDEFGEGSYYINYGDRPNTAFLVVKVKETVYALTYKKELHSYIESLIKYLSS